MSTLGQGLLKPKSGDGLCVIYHNLQLILELLSKNFVRSLLGIFTYLQIALVQHLPTVARGQNLPTVGSCGQAVRGTTQAEQIATITGLHKGMVTRNQIPTLVATRILMVHSQVVQKLVRTFQLLRQKTLSMDSIERMVHTLHHLSRHIELVTLGIVPLNLGGAC